MRGWQLVLAAGLYLWAAFDYFRSGERADAAAWFFYCCANIAFAWKVIWK